MIELQKMGFSPLFLAIKYILTTPKICKNHLKGRFKDSIVDLAKKIKIIYYNIRVAIQAVAGCVVLKGEQQKNKAA